MIWNACVGTKDEQIEKQAWAQAAFNASLYLTLVWPRFFERQLI